MRWVLILTDPLGLHPEDFLYGGVICGDVSMGVISDP